MLGESGGAFSPSSTATWWLLPLVHWFLPDSTLYTRAGGTPWRCAQSEMLTPACLNSERALLIWSAEKEVACFSTREFYKVLSILKSIIQNSDSLSTRLVELRQELGLSRDELAAKLDVSHATLWRLENGQSSATVELLGKMEVVGLDVIYLLSGIRATCVSRVDDDETWGRAAQAVSKAMVKHGLSPSPATYWRMVRLLYSEAINEGDLRKDVAQVLEKAGRLAVRP